MERRNARDARRRGDLPVRAGPARRRRLVHLADEGPAGRPRVLRAALRRARHGQAAVRGRPRAGRQGRRRARSGRCAARRSRASRASPASSAAPRVLGFASSGLPGPEGQPRDVRAGSPRPAATGRSPTWRRALAEVAGVTAPRAVAVLSHARPGETDDALRHLIALAAPARDGRPRSTARRPPSTGDRAGAGRRARRDAHATTSTSRIALGGDGTILRALREFAGTSVPGVRGELRRDRLPGDGRPRRGAGGVRARARGRLRDADAARRSRSSATARRGSPINDIAIHAQGRRARRRPRLRGRRARRSAACAATASSSPRRPARPATTSPTAGPVMAWGVEGFVVSFIAPHSLTARALVVAPGDLLTVHNRSESAVDVAFDGRPAGEIAAGRHDHRRLRPRGGRPRAAARARRSTAACARSSGGSRSLRAGRPVRRPARCYTVGSCSASCASRTCC